MYLYNIYLHFFQLLYIININSIYLFLIFNKIINDLNIKKNSLINLTKYFHNSHKDIF